MGEGGPELSKDRVTLKVMAVKDNYVVIRMASRIEMVRYKLAEGKGLREGWDSKEVWKSVEKSEAARG
jgi:hypothetical protein